MRSYIDLNKLLENFGIQSVNNNLNVFREKYKIYFLPESVLQLIYTLIDLKHTPQLNLMILRVAMALPKTSMD